VKAWQQEPDEPDWTLVDDEVIDLEPYVVSGDDTLLLPFIRWRLEVGPESVRRHVEDMAPALTAQANLAARASQRFYDQNVQVGPRDRAPIVYVTDEAMIRAGRDIGTILKGLFGR
jgi:hypothetical protein